MDTKQIEQLQDQLKRAIELLRRCYHERLHWGTRETLTINLRVFLNEMEANPVPLAKSEPSLSSVTPEDLISQLKTTLGIPK